MISTVILKKRVLFQIVGVGSNSSTTHHWPICSLDNLWNISLPQISGSWFFFLYHLDASLHITNSQSSKVTYGGLEMEPSPDVNVKIPPCLSSSGRKKLEKVHWSPEDSYGAIGSALRDATVGKFSCFCRKLDAQPTNQLNGKMGYLN